MDRTKLNAEDDEALKEEVAILGKMKHLHIVELFDFFEEPKKYYIVLEICEGGELFDRIVQKVGRGITFDVGIVYTHAGMWEASRRCLGVYWCLDAAVP